MDEILVDEVLSLTLNLLQPVAVVRGLIWGSEL